MQYYTAINLGIDVVKNVSRYEYSIGNAERN